MRSRKLIFTLLAVVLTGGSIIALAAWTANGTGSGSAKATSSQGVTTDAVTIAAGTLYPGGTADVKVKVNNANPFPVTVSAIAGNGAITSGDAGCDASNGVSFTGQSGLSQAVPANGSVELTLANAASMSNASVDACQSKTFTIPVAITAASSA